MTTKLLTERIRSIMKKTTVEPFIFFVMFGYNVRLVTLQSLLHDRACRVSLNFSDYICDNIDTLENEDQQVKAVRFGNNVYLAMVLLSTIPALIIAAFLGPWSDRYSRKYPMILASTGILIDTCLQLIPTSYEHTSPLWFLPSCLVSGLSGGLLIVLSSSYSYMSDVTDERSRQVRYTIVEFFTLMATPTGSFIGGKIYSAGGYMPVMITAACSFLVALLYARFVVVETKPKRFDITKKQMLMDVLKLDNMKESFRTSMQPRPGNLRLQIWLLVGTSFFLRFINMGSIAIGFPYTRHVFKWDVERYSYTATIFSLVNAFATVVIVPILNRRLLVHEAAIGLIGILSLAAKMIILSVSVYEVLIFYAWICGCLYACGGIAIRSRISKLVPRNELGKVFSLLATFDSPSPVLGIVILTQIFNTSVHFYPGMAYAVGVLILLPPGVVFTWMMRLPTMSFVQYQETEQAKSMKELKSVSSNVF